MAKAGVVSSGIIGYQDITVPAGYSLFTVTFKEVGGSDTYNINNITVCNTDGTTYTTINKMRLNKMDDAGSYLTTYNYRYAKGGWCQNATFVDNIVLKSGEAVCLNNTSGGSLVMRVAGQVEVNPISYTLPTGYSLIGNMTPVTVNVNDIVPYYQVEGEWVVYPTINKVRLNKMDTEGSYLTTYNYRQAKGGWCQNATLQENITLAPGESFCVNNTTGVPIQLRYKSPVSNN